MSSKLPNWRALSFSSSVRCAAMHVSPYQSFGDHPAALLPGVGWRAQCQLDGKCRTQPCYVFGDLWETHLQTQVAGLPHCATWDLCSQCGANHPARGPGQAGCTTQLSGKGDLSCPSCCLCCCSRSCVPDKRHTEPAARRCGGQTTPKLRKHYKGGDHSTLVQSNPDRSNRPLAEMKSGFGLGFLENHRDWPQLTGSFGEVKEHQEALK